MFGFIISLLTVVASPALAVGEISYVDFQHNASTRALYASLQPPPLADTPVGLSDLNNDGIEEMIVRHCRADSQICLHSIWTEREGGYTKLGEISALRLALGHKSHHGVRDIWAYDDPRNDYHAIVYLWDAMNSGYIKE